MVTRSAPSQRQVRRLLDPLVTRAAATPGSDRYRKRFTTLAHLWVLLLHVLLGSDSLRQTHGVLCASTRWWHRWGLTTWISFSQLARSSSSRPLDCVETLFADTVTLAHRTPSTDPLWRKLRRVEAVDSTFLSLSGKLSPWSVRGGAAPGVRIQCGLELLGQIPDDLRLTTLETNDHDGLWQRDLSTRRGWTLLKDLGYYGHRQFQRLREAGVHFITRLNQQASYVVTAERQVPQGPTPDGDVILRDAIITLGSPNNRRGAVLPGMRLIVSRNQRGVEHQFVTDRHDLTATEVVMLYRKRWQIELFFRWLKRQLGGIHPIGYSRNAVWLTILLVAIVALMLSLLDTERPRSVSRISWTRGAGEALLEAIRDG